VRTGQILRGDQEMKKLILVCLAIGLVLAIGAPAMAGTLPGSGIAGSFHDLSSGSGGAASYGDPGDHGTLNRICIYCHAPHNTIKPDVPGGTWTYMPLWNHGKTTNVGAFQMYSNGSDLPGAVQAQSQAMILANQPGSVSLLCLSCHDGSISTNMYGSGSSVGQDNVKIAAGARASIGFGGDLSNHHPIGFNYANVQAFDEEIYPVGTAVLQGAPYGVKTPGGPATIQDLLWGNNVECVSCHDVHNTKNGGTKLTWVEDNNSRLCLTCHNK
jgi:predicted CXXCH cytochrome family protein